MTTAEWLGSCMLMLISTSVYEWLTLIGSWPSGPESLPSFRPLTRKPRSRDIWLHLCVSSSRRLLGTWEKLRGPAAEALLQHGTHKTCHLSWVFKRRGLGLLETYPLFIPIPMKISELSPLYFVPVVDFHPKYPSYYWPSGDSQKQPKRGSSNRQRLL